MEIDNNVKPGISALAEKVRYEYIDLLKGFTIIWVLWMHMNLPEWIYPSVQMPVFFFVSGTFYHAKAKTLWQQVRKDAYHLLVPTLVFSLFAFFYRVTSGQPIGGGICKTVNESLSASIVWFLIALFYFRCMAYVCVKTKKILLLLIALLIYAPGFYLYANHRDWILPFVPLAHMGVFMVWFALGVLWGKDVLHWLASAAKLRIGIWLLLCIGYVLLVHCVEWESVVRVHVPWLVKGVPYTAGVILLMLYAAYRLERVGKIRPVTKVLSYVGKNSIVFYLTHWPLWMYLFKPLGWNAYFSFLCIVLLEFPLIYVFTHWLPWCIGKTYKRKL